MPEGVDRDAGIDRNVQELVRRGRRPRAVRLWLLLNREERKAAARSAIDDGDRGRNLINDAVATALHFRPQTVRRWAPDRVAAKMAVVPLHDPKLARILVLHCVHAEDNLPMLGAFLADLGIPHDDGHVEQFAKLDAAQFTLETVAARTIEEHGARGLVLYLLFLWLSGAPLGAKAGAWLRERWGLAREPRDKDGTPRASDSNDLDRQTAADLDSAGAATDGQPTGPAPEGQKAGLGTIRGGTLAAEDEAVAQGTRSRPEAAEVDELGAAPTALAPSWTGGEERPARLTTLDGLLQMAIQDCVREIQGALNEDQIDDAIDEFRVLNGTRHESYFHAGYRDVLFQRQLGELLEEAHPEQSRWYWAGAVGAWAMREKWSRIAREYDENDWVRELASGHHAASAAAVIPIVEALDKVGRGTEVGRALTAEALIVAPKLFEQLLAMATRLLRDDHPADARHILALLHRVSDVLDERGTAPEQRVLLDARRRYAHSLRARREHDLAGRLLNSLLEEDPDPNTHAMVHADLGLMAGSFNSLEDVALPARQDMAKSIRDRLARGVDHFRQSVREAAEYSAHGHYTLGVLALANGDDEAAERHLAAAHMHFSAKAQSYGALVARSSLYGAIAKARQLQPDKLAHAAKVIVDAIEAGATFPIHLAGDTVGAFELADDKRSLRRVVEAIVGQGGDVMLDELADSGAAQRHCPLLADRLHARAASDRRPAKARASDLRAALAGRMHAQSYVEARNILDDLEQLALSRVAASDFLDLLEEPSNYDPAWDLDDALIARAHCHEARGELLEAMGLLRKLFFSLMARGTASSLEDARGLLDRVRGYGRDPSLYADMTDHYEAVVGEQGDPASDASHDPASELPVRVLVVGGAELQAKSEEAARAEIGRRHPHIRPKFIYVGWGSRWDRQLAEFEREAERHDALVILRFMRTNLGRHIRQLWPGDRPWRFCWSGGPGAIAEAAGNAAAFVRQT